MVHNVSLVYPTETPYNHSHLMKTSPEGKKMIIHVSGLLSLVACELLHRSAPVDYQSAHTLVAWSSGPTTYIFKKKTFRKNKLVDKD
jgi:hypothetical protein